MSTDSKPKTVGERVIYAITYLVIMVGGAFLFWWVAGLVADGTGLLNRPAWAVLLLVVFEVVVQPITIGKPREPRTPGDAITSSILWLLVGYLAVQSVVA